MNKYIYKTFKKIPNMLAFYRMFLNNIFPDWNLNWAFQFRQAKNWKATNFGSKKYKVTRFGSYKMAIPFCFESDWSLGLAWVVGTLSFCQVTGTHCKSSEDQAHVDEIYWCSVFELQRLDSLRAREAIWHHGTWSTLVFGSGNGLGPV